MTNDRILACSAGLTTKQLQQIVTALAAGQIVCAPTETRYGLLVRADQEEPLGRLFELKKRPVVMPTALFVCALDDIRRFALLSPLAEQIARCFLPGPLTLVLPSVIQASSLVQRDNFIGVRWSSHPIIQSITTAADFPLTATSANISGEPEPDQIETLVEQFGSGIDLYLDAGPCTAAPSTVVRIDGETIDILRSGKITERMIAHCVAGAMELHG